jgi:hypothetical protein
MGLGVTVAREGHALGHTDVGVVGDHSQAKLSPAVVTEESAIFDLGFFVEFLTKLDGISVSTVE